MRLVVCSKESEARKYDLAVVSQPTCSQKPSLLSLDDLGGCRNCDHQIAHVKLPLLAGQHVDKIRCSAGWGSSGCPPSVAVEIESYENGLSNHTSRYLPSSAAV
jgi:hypothetical protein